LTLGSAAVGTAGDFFQQSANAAQRLGLRAVLLVGRDPQNQLKGEMPPGVIAILYAPHAAVFPGACVVVHQGGIGTTGEAMRAGRPMLVVPYSHDQPDHAARLTRLGAARRIPRERYNSGTTAREIATLLHDSRYAERAADIGVRVRSEMGTASACDLLSSLLEKANSETGEPWANGSRSLLIDYLEGILATNGRAVGRRRRVRTLANRPKRLGENTRVLRKNLGAEEGNLLAPLPASH
jgi:UDP:flavonoid glycosyltransferase YjiC (YdhE family)